MMKSVGLIVEYNPFHNGHDYHMQQSIQESGAQITIAVMSGYFLQRGEPALVSKWQRAKMALDGGADLVIELPYAFSTGKAEIFANGAVSLLTALKTDEVSFGSEQGTIAPFEGTIDFLDEHQETYQEKLKSFLAEGYSFPKASALAFGSFHDREGIVDLSKPNNILGFHYVKAIHDQNSPMKATTIQRIGAGYHDPDLGSKEIASATGIRKAIASGDDTIANVQGVVPDFTYNALLAAYRQQGLFHSWERMFPYLQYRLLTAEAHELADIYEAEEGLEHRLQAAIKQADSFTSFMKQIKTKRYTWTRLQRLCTHILTNTTKKEMAPVLQNPQATYIRLLGMSENGQAYLNHVKKDLELPLVSTLSKHEDPLLALDKRAADCYVLGYPVELRANKLQEEYAMPPIMASQ